jgi:plasmid stability protein
MKMIQIRNVPDELHRSLKERAAREGTTLSDPTESTWLDSAHVPRPRHA